MFNFLQRINNSWRTKAKKRRLENKNLKKEIKRVKDSRNKWKEKAVRYKQENIELNKELKKNE